MNWKYHLSFYPVYGSTVFHSAPAYFVQLFGVVAGDQKQDIRADVLRHGVVVAHNLAVVH